MDDSIWTVPTDPFLLGPDEVHIWRIPLFPTEQIRNALYQTLSMDERNRASRFYFDRDRNAFVTARGTLRTSLGRYLDIHPNNISFQFTEYGKPYLPNEYGDGSIRFNLSHSHEQALLAITRNRDIGVDIEWIRPEFTGDAIAARFFSSNENTMLRSVPDAQRHDAFFACWTRKEAYIKALGHGLSLPLDSFDVTLVPGQPAQLLSTRPNASEASRWSLHTLNPGPGYAAAVCIEGHGLELKCLQWHV